MNLTGYILLAIVLALAILFVVLYLKSRAAAEGAGEVSRREADTLREQLAVVRTERDRYLDEKIELGRELTAATTRAGHLHERLEQQAGELNRIHETFKTEFENLASRLLEEKSEKFTRQNQTNIQGLLKPLQERITEFEKKVSETYHQEARERFGLQKELNRMFELNRTLSEQADNLTQALKSDPKKQGNWGEFLLERVLESSGLAEGIHYQKQYAVTDAEGQLRRPDVVILLPENRRVVIDAKVSLTAYERYCSAPDDAASALALRDHLQSVRRHVEELAPKHYERLFDQSPDFVLMFIPTEPAYGLALMEDTALFTDAFRKNVILVSVSSLLATLRVIETMWRLEKQNRNAAEIVRQGSLLYDKFVAFTEDLQSLGQKLNAARAGYEQAMNKLTLGNGNLVRRAEQMKHLGLDTKKRLPDEWVDESEGPLSPAQTV